MHMTLEEFISLARENLTLFARRYKKHHKLAHVDFPLDGTEDDWVERYRSHVADITRMRKETVHGK
jgi:hypothetical protein